MKTTLYTLLIFLSLTGVASAKEPQKDKNQNYKILDRQLIAKFHRELTFNFIKSKKPVIKNNLTSLLLMSDFIWSMQTMAGDINKDKKAYPLLLAKLNTKHQPKKLNKCRSLMNVIDKGNTLVPIYDKEIEKPTKTSFDMFTMFYHSPSYFGNLKKYDVTLEQYSKVLSWQYGWNQPVSCACQFNEDIVQFCKKYGYEPLSVSAK